LAGFNKNFSVDERVKIVNTNELLDGTTGTILGQSTTGVINNAYIVLLDVPLTTHKAITMPESLLERIP
jgi:hypothetical protein